MQFAFMYMQFALIYVQLALISDYSVTAKGSFAVNSLRLNHTQGGLDQHNLSQSSGLSHDFSRGMFGMGLSFICPQMTQPECCYSAFARPVYICAVLLHAFGFNHECRW